MGLEHIVMGDFNIDLKLNPNKKWQNPWYLSFRCLAIRQRELKKHKNRIVIVRCAETSRITIGPNQSVNVRGSLD